MIARGRVQDLTDPTRIDPYPGRLNHALAFQPLKRPRPRVIGPLVEVVAVRHNPDDTNSGRPACEAQRLPAAAETRWWMSPRWLSPQPSGPEQLGLRLDRRDRARILCVGAPRSERRLWLAPQSRPFSSRSNQGGTANSPMSLMPIAPTCEGRRRKASQLFSSCTSHTCLSKVGSTPAVCDRSHGRRRPTAAR
jgi:hypothetical protein